MELEDHDRYQVLPGTSLVHDQRQHRRARACNAANRPEAPGPSNPVLKETITAAVAAYTAAGVSTPIPIDL